MSSSDDDSDFMECSPPVELPQRRGNRRKATPSPRKVPKKKLKHREALADFNVGMDDSDEEDSDDSIEPPRRRAAQAQLGKRKKSLTNDSSEEEINEGSDISNGSGVSDERENRPPPPPASSVVVSNVDIPEDSSQPVANGDSVGRTRKRLSIRSSDFNGSSSDIRSTVSGVSNGESVISSATEVQTIYETCSQMFNANRINAQNAFNLRLLDCINQMINSPNYDKSNMQLTSSTVEIGTRIYVCRVDNAHSQVLSLASDITLQQRRKQKDGKGKEGEDGANQDNDGMDHGGDALEDDEEHDVGRRKKQKKTTKKRGRFVEEDNAKLLTGLEEQNVKYVTRRNVLKRKFTEMIYEDLEFDYMSYFLEPEDIHPLLTKKESDQMKTVAPPIPEGYINPMEMGRLDFLPFHHLAKFDPETHDIWGRPLNAVEDIRDDMLSQDPQLPINNEFAYDPANRPAEYPDEMEADNLMDATLGEGIPFSGDGDGDEIQPVSFHNIQSLDHLDNYFQRVKGLLKESRSRFGWCGPNFVKPKSTWPVKQGPRKPKTRKDPERICFANLDWADKANKFSTNSTARTVYDDKVIESWSSTKVVIPFLGIELASCDDEFDAFDPDEATSDGVDPKYVPPIFKLFTNRKRSILDLLKSDGRRRNASGSSLCPPDVGDEGFDNDIELPRDMVEDFCSQPANDNEDGFQPGCSGPALEAGWQFPSSLPDGLLNDDPLSRVSDIDSIRFSRKPKPIDMSALKKAILKTLVSELTLDTTGQPLKEEETKIGLALLMFKVLQAIDSRTEKLLSVSIFVVALMHVVAEKTLFVIYDDSDPTCPVVICRGKSFNHFDHIPMPTDCPAF